MTDKTTRMTVLTSIFILILYFFSGAAGLNYQVIWLRYLKLLFGVTHISVSLIVSAFMTGLALGSYYIGRYADRTRRPLLFFGLSELAVGLYALLSPQLFGLVDDSYVWLSRSGLAGDLTAHLLRYTATFAVLIIPTSLMGGTFPLVSKAFIRTREGIRGGTAVLYGINTLGAMTGAFLAGFLFLRTLGTVNSLHIAAAMNITVGAVSLLLNRTAVGTSGDAPAAAAAAEESEIKTMRDRIIFWGFGLSGFISLSYEVLWTRSLIFFLGLTSYAFTTILVTFLAGIGLGSMTQGWIHRRIRDYGRAFGWIEAGIGLSALAAVPLVQRLHPFSAGLLQNWEVTSWAGIMSVKFLIAFTVMLLPTFLMGMSMPVVIGYFSRERRELGTNIGRIYSVNTVGSIFGSLAAGFIFIPILGIQASITFMVLLNLGLAMAVLFNRGGGIRGNIPQISVTAVGTVLALVFFINSDEMIYASPEFSGQQKRYKLLFAHEGPEASIAVLQDKINNERELNINGESTAFTIYQDMQVHKLLAHLPALIHPDPKDFLVVGFGFGSTSYGSSLYPGAQVDCVEILKDEIRTAPYFEKENHRVIEKDNFHLIINDGRDYIRTTEKDYDIISFNAIHPKISPNLYTYEFYQSCREILRPDGMIIAWLPPNAITEEEYRSMIRTFSMVYEHTSLWYVNPSHMLLMGSREPLSISWKRLEERLSIPEVRADLAETNYDRIRELLSNYIASGEVLDGYFEGAPFNSDDFPVIEFSRVTSVSVNLDVTESLLRLRRSIMPLLTDVPDSLAETLARDLDRYNLMKDHVIQAQVYAWTGEYDRAENYYERALAMYPNPNAEYLLGKVETIESELRELLKYNPRNEKVLKALGERNLKRNDLTAARGNLLRALSIRSDYYEARHLLGIVYFYQNNGQASLQEFRKVIDQEPKYAPAHFYSGLCYWKMGKLDRATSAFRTAMDLDPGEANNYLWYAKALEMAGKKREALDVYNNLLDIDPVNTEALNAVDRLGRMNPGK